MIPRIAYVSPMPPARTGVAAYSAAVLAELRATGFAGRHSVEVVWPITGAAEAAVRRADLAVYHLGNNVEFHGDIYDLAARHPGLVVLHDLALDDLARGLLDGGDPFGARTREEAVAARERLGDRAPPGPLETPWCAFAARRARGVMVHADYGRRYLEAFGCRTPVHVVPHPVPPPPRRGVLRAARRIRARFPDRSLIGVLGDIGRAKGIGAVLDAVRSLDARVHLAVVGRRIPGYDVEEEVSRRHLEGSVTVAADVADDAFLAWLHACDVLVNLRHPHRGEVSGTLVRALAAGIPTVVSAVGTYLDWPAEAVVRVPAGPPDPRELASALGTLVRDPARRREIGERARAHVRRLAEEHTTAHGYRRAIVETLRLVRDPARAALGRWAAALADMGAGPEAVGRGHGDLYLEALEEFSEGDSATT